jgi:hypothetical protein
MALSGLEWRSSDVAARGGGAGRGPRGSRREGAAVEVEAIERGRRRPLSTAPLGPGCQLSSERRRRADPRDTTSRPAARADGRSRDVAPGGSSDGDRVDFQSTNAGRALSLQVIRSDHSLRSFGKAEFTAQVVGASRHCGMTPIAVLESRPRRRAINGSRGPWAERSRREGLRGAVAHRSADITAQKAPC